MARPEALVDETIRLRKEEITMQIEIWAAGDTSISNTGGFATVNIPDFELWWADGQTHAAEVRETVREALTTAFQEIFDDGSVVAVFEDELGPARRQGNVVHLIPRCS